MHQDVIGCVLLFCFSAASQAAGQPLPEVRRYQLLRYPAVQPVTSDRRARAAAAEVTVNFTALGRPFRLLLTPDLVTLPAALRLSAPGGAAPPPTLYRGSVQGEPGSRVYGSLLGGVFQGTIEVPPLAYYVEPSVVLQDGADVPADAHSVIYASSDVRVPAGAGCGFRDEDENTEQDRLEELRNDLPEHRHSQEQTVKDDGDLRSLADFEARRRRYLLGRGAQPPPENPNKHQAGMCTMSIETDPMLWRYALNMFGGDVRQTRDYLISLIGTHMVFVNNLYAGESFDGEYQHAGLQFQLQKLLITDTSSCAPGYVGEASRFCAENVDYQDFLMLQSEGDHSEFCLAFAFTYRDFTESVMGFAWKASRDVTDKFSGVCGSPGLRLMEKDGAMKKVRLSKNCGIVSLLNFGKRVSVITSHITFAHEMGHTLGSPHDLPENKRPECVPGGHGGMFIMYPYSVSGYDPNNSHFSPCSQGNISRVLDIIANGHRRQCFVTSTGSYCGNRVREPGEECDCGFSADTCEDRCCYPRELTEQDRAGNGSAAGCARRHATQCSGSEGPCCHPDTCRLVTAAEGRVCHPEDDCVHAATCNGSSAVCPLPAHKPNMTSCQAGARVCVDGLCQASACIKEGLQECLLTEEDVLEPRELCLVACNVPGYPGCRVMTPGPIQRPAGSSCNNASGYCDVFGRCRPYRDDGPLGRVRRLIFTGQGHKDLLAWLQHNWWAAVLLVLVLATLLAVIVRCAAVHTPSSNPQRPPPRLIKDTLHHPVDALGLPSLDKVKQCCARGWPGARQRTTTTTPSAPAATKATSNDFHDDAANIINYTAQDVDDALDAADAADWSETSSFEHVRQPRWSRGSSVATSASIIREARAGSDERPSTFSGLESEPSVEVHGRRQHPGLGIVASDTSHQPAGLTHVEI